MTKQELIDRVTARVPASEQLSKKTVSLLVDTVFDELGEYFVKARVTARRVPRFTYPGFGTFTKKERAARPGRDPRTGEAIEIPASTTVGFQPGQDLRAELNRATRKGARRSNSNGRPIATEVVHGKAQDHG